ncbi:MAG: M23 family metallopeptidase [Candidatus Latescibacterota bacterium]
MIKRSIYTILLCSMLWIAGGGLAATGATARDGSRIWPLTNTPSLSSSFGEYRNGHLHAGIDLRTGGRDGVSCRAVGDGYVSRVRTSPFGYGKALYLRLHNGETAVYAHLSEFSSFLEDYVYEEQLRLGRYQVDLFPDSQHFPVREGDIIAYSGSTGSGAPHLHFEIRDSVEKPMNPLRSGWNLPDAIPPVFDRIVWIPLGKQSRIDGSASPRETTAEKQAGGRFICRDTVSLSGPVGIAARVYDRHDGSSGRLAPYRVELVVDGMLVTKIEMDRFSFKQSTEVDLIYEMERAYADSRHFLTLFERQGETVWNRWFLHGGAINPALPDAARPSVGPKGRTPGSAAARFADSLHTAELRAWDCFGNSSVLSVTFSRAGTEAMKPPPMPAAGAKGAAAEFPGLYLFDDLLSIRTDVLGNEGMSQLYAACDSMQWAEDGEATWTGAWQFTASSTDFDTVLVVLPPAPSFSDSPLYLIPVQGKPIEQLYIPGLKLSIGVPGRALYGPGFIYLTEWRKKRPALGELTIRSKIIRIGPPSLATRSFLELSFPSTVAWSEKEAVYELNEKKGTWSYIPTLSTDESVSAHIHRPGIFAVLTDPTPPKIGTPVLRRHRMYADGRTFPEIVITLADKGAGIDAESTEIFLDGAKQIARWDGFSKKIFVLLREQNIIGTHKLSITALDHAGNESRLQTNLTITKDYFSDSEQRNTENAE